MAGTLYPPAFAALTHWGGARRVRALTTLTLVAGLASTVFAPLASALDDVLGWRQAYARAARRARRHHRAAALVGTRPRLAVRRSRRRHGPPRTRPASASITVRSTAVRAADAANALAALAVFAVADQPRADAGRAGHEPQRRRPGARPRAASARWRAGSATPGSPPRTSVTSRGVIVWRRRGRHGRARARPGVRRSAHRARDGPRAGARASTRSSRPPRSPTAGGRRPTARLNGILTAPALAASAARAVRRRRPRARCSGPTPTRSCVLAGSGRCRRPPDAGRHARGTRPRPTLRPAARDHRSICVNIDACRTPAPTTWPPGADALACCVPLAREPITDRAGGRAWCRC